MLWLHPSPPISISVYVSAVEVLTTVSVVFPGIWATTSELAADPGRSRPSCCSVLTRFVCFFQHLQSGHLTGDLWSCVYKLPLHSNCIKFVHMIGTGAACISFIRCSVFLISPDASISILSRDYMRQKPRSCRARLQPASSASNT